MKWPDDTPESLAFEEYCRTAIHRRPRELDLWSKEVEPDEDGLLRVLFAIGTDTPLPELTDEIREAAFRTWTGPKVPHDETAFHHEKIRMMCWTGEMRGIPTRKVRRILARLTGMKVDSIRRIDQGRPHWPPESDPENRKLGRAIAEMKRHWPPKSDPNN